MSQESVIVLLRPSVSLSVISHQSARKELRQQEGVSENKQERISRHKRDDTAEAQVHQHLRVMQNVV